MPIKAAAIVPTLTPTAMPTSVLGTRYLIVSPAP